jgi:hypothetical protein
MGNCSTKSEKITPNQINNIIALRQAFEGEKFNDKYNFIKTEIYKSLNHQFNIEKSTRFKFHIKVEYQYSEVLRITHEVIKCLRKILEEDGWVFTVHRVQSISDYCDICKIKVNLTHKKCNKKISKIYFVVNLYTEQIEIPDDKCIYKTPEKLITGNTCVLCNVNPSNTFFFPCYHSVVCMQCAMEGKVNDRCNSCDEEVTSYVENQ